MSKSSSSSFDWGQRGSPEWALKAVRTGVWSLANEMKHRESEGFSDDRCASCKALFGNWKSLAMTIGEDYHVAVSDAKDAYEGWNDHARSPEERKAAHLRLESRIARIASVDRELTKELRAANAKELKELVDKFKTVGDLIGISKIVDLAKKLIGWSEDDDE